jgi:hypothetical protein
LALGFSGSAGYGVAIGCRNRRCCGGSVKTDETEDERLALVEEDDVAARLRDEELKNAARQIRGLSADNKGAAA